MACSRDDTIPDGSHPHRPEQIRHASEQLATILESLDLEDETQLADEVIEAIRATDRAYELEAETTNTNGAYELETTVLKPARGSDGFRFPSSLVDGRAPRDREPY